MTDNRICSRCGRHVPEPFLGHVCPFAEPPEHGTRDLLREAEVYLREQTGDLLADAVALATPSLTWTPKRPTQPGWYWWRSQHDSVPQIVHLWRDGCGLCLAGSGWSLPDGFWAGPIPEPTP